MEKRPVIGLFVNDLVGSYQYALWAGVESAARDRGMDLVVFSGGELGSDNQTKRMRNLVFELANIENLDGLIIVASALGNHLSPKEIARFLEAYKPLPMVCLGLEVPGMPCVLVDNATGMMKAVEHLIVQHNRFHPVFIGGPSMNAEAQARRDAVLKVLNQHHVAMDPALDLIAEFDFGLAKEALLSVLDAGNTIDMVIAANDDMALGAMEALQERGIKIPEDVSVVGFDDIEDSRFCSPSLSTVRQPLQMQGAKAVDMLVVLMRGESIASRNILPAGFVPRRSCGCQSAAVASAIAIPELPLEESPTVHLGEFAHIEELTDVIDLFSQGSRDTDLPLRLGIALRNDVSGKSTGATLQLLDQLIRNQESATSQNHDYQMILSRLRLASLPFANDAEIDALEGIFHQLRVALAEITTQQASYNTVQTERWTRKLHEISGRFLTIFDEDLLVDELAIGLQTLGIDSCTLSLFDGEEKKQLRTILSYTGGKRDQTAENQLVFHDDYVTDVVQRGFTRRSLSIEPLFFNEVHIGLALFELSPRRGMLQDALCTQISAALRGARLSREIQAHTKKLEDANIQLKNSQHQIIVAEKMASLGRLTASIAHELNTPIAALRSCLNQSQRLVQEYQEAVESASLSIEDHANLAKELASAINIASRAGDKAATFLRSIKSQTRDMGEQDKDVFDALPVIDESLLLLQHFILASGIVVEKKYDITQAYIRGIPSRLIQVINNLITNAIQSLKNKSGRIAISVYLSESQAICLEVRDTGCGIAPENLPRIYEPLFSTKSIEEGIGLGLSIVRDILQADFGAEIEVESQTTIGTTFLITFPSTPLESSL